MCIKLGRHQTTEFFVLLWHLQWFIYYESIQLKCILYYQLLQSHLNCQILFWGRCLCKLPICLSLSVFSYTQVPCKVIHIHSGNNLAGHTPELASHFRTIGAPVMMGKVSHEVNIIVKVKLWTVLPYYMLENYNLWYHHQSDKIVNTRYFKRVFHDTFTIQSKNLVKLYWNGKLVKWTISSSSEALRLVIRILPIWLW